ncbi:hypothetical protein [Fusibacter sp. JL216-2]
MIKAPRTDGANREEGQGRKPSYHGENGNAPVSGSLKLGRLYL